MNFSIFCSDSSLQSSLGLHIVEIAGFRRNSSKLGTTWGTREESSEKNNNSWKYLYLFQILASIVKLINYFISFEVLLHVSFLSSKKCSDILLFTLWTRPFFHSFIFHNSSTSTRKIVFIYYLVNKSAKNFFFFGFRVKPFNQC